MDAITKLGAHHLVIELPATGGGGVALEDGRIDNGFDDIGRLAEGKWLAVKDRNFSVRIQQVEGHGNNGGLNMGAPIRLRWCANHGIGPNGLRVSVEVETRSYKLVRPTGNGVDSGQPRNCCRGVGFASISLGPAKSSNAVSCMGSSGDDPLKKTAGQFLAFYVAGLSEHNSWH